MIRDTDVSVPASEYNGNLANLSEPDLNTALKKIDELEVGTGGGTNFQVVKVIETVTDTERTATLTTYNQIEGSNTNSYFELYSSDNLTPENENQYSSFNLGSANGIDSTAFSAYHNPIAGGLTYNSYDGENDINEKFDVLLAPKNSSVYPMLEISSQLHGGSFIVNSDGTIVSNMRIIQTVRIELTATQFTNLNSVPITILANAAGKIAMPISARVIVVKSSATAISGTIKIIPSGTVDSNSITICSFNMVYDEVGKRHFLSSLNGVLSYYGDGLSESPRGLKLHGVGCSAYSPDRFIIDVNYILMDCVTY